MSFADTITPNGHAPLFTPTPSKAQRKAAAKAAAQVAHFENRFVPPDHRLAEHWEFVKEALDNSKSGLLAKVRPAGFYSFRSEDVYMAIKLAQVVLYVVYLDGRRSGFGITRRVEDTFKNDAPYLLSWLGWCDRHEATALYFKELENVARGLKLKEIRHYSTRKGWILHPPTEDWELQTADGWLPLKTADREVRKGLYQAFELVPEICMRRVV